MGLDRIVCGDDPSCDNTVSAGVRWLKEVMRGEVDDVPREEYVGEMDILNVREVTVNKVQKSSTFNGIGAFSMTERCSHF